MRSTNHRLAKIEAAVAGNGYLLAPAPAKMTHAEAAEVVENLFAIDALRLPDPHSNRVEARAFGWSKDMLEEHRVAAAEMNRWLGECAGVAPEALFVAIRPAKMHAAYDALAGGAKWILLRELAQPTGYITPGTHEAAELAIGRWAAATGAPYPQTAEQAAAILLALWTAAAEEKVILLMWADWDEQEGLP